MLIQSFPNHITFPDLSPAFQTIANLITNLSLYELGILLNLIENELHKWKQVGEQVFNQN